MCRKCNAIIKRVEEIKKRCIELEGELGFLECDLLDRGYKDPLWEVNRVMQMLIGACENVVKYAKEVKNE